MSSALETLVQDFKKLDQFLTQQVKNSANDTEKERFECVHTFITEICID